MDNFYQFGALVSAITFSGAGIFIKKINTRNFFSIPFYEGLFSILIMLLIITFLSDWQATILDNSSSIVINFMIAATLSSTGTMIYIFSLSKTSIGIALTVCAAFNVLTASTYDYVINSVSFDILFFFGAALILISIFILNIKSFFSKNKINLIGVFGAILTGIFWGSAVFFNDKALIESNIFIASVIRSLTAMLVMFTASIIFRNKIDLKTDIKIFKLFIITVVLLFLSNIVWFVSLEYTTGSLTTIFGSSAPIFGIILGYIFLKEKIGRVELLSIFVALCGIAIMISK